MKDLLTIGRSEENDIVIDQPQVSGRHAVLSLVDRDIPRFLLRDLDSTNGTFKNDERVESCEVELGDTILIANIELAPALYRPLLSGQMQGTAQSPSPPSPISTTQAPEVFENNPPRDARLGSMATLRANSLLLLLLFLLLGVGLYVVSGIPNSLRMWEPGNFSLQQFAGALLVSGALVQLGLWLLSRQRRLNYERQQHVLSLKLWETRVEMARRRQALKVGPELVAWKGLRKFKVVHKVEESVGIASFYLAPHDGKPLSPFKPGQYLTFSLKIPGQPLPVVRCYSLSSSTAELDHYRVSIKRLPPPQGKPDLPSGLSSSFFHDQVEAGEILDLRAPAGHFFLNLEKDAPIVLIGGGIGVTPVLSMLNTVIDYNQQREIWFFYGVRNRREHIMEEQLRVAEQMFSNVHLQICYSDPDEEDVQGLHYHHAERVSVDLFKRLLPSNNYEFYICGPPPMMDSITTDLETWGVPADHIHFEAFGPASAKKVTHGEGTPEPTTGQYTVNFEKSEKHCQWQPDSGSLLELAEANGVTIDYGCRAGNCGTCLVAIREGKVDYLHVPGVEPEAGSCLACIARPAGEPGKDRLVLDA